MELYYVVRKGAKIKEYKYIKAYLRKEDAEEVLKWNNEHLHIGEHELRCFRIDKERVCE